MDYPSLIKCLRERTMDELCDMREEMAEFLPPLRVMFDFDLQNRAHPYDLWRHSLYVVKEVAAYGDRVPDVLVLAALLHDIGKPSCPSPDKEEGWARTHYYGHPEKSADLVRQEILPLLDMDVHDAGDLVLYVRHHDDDLSPANLEMLRRSLGRARVFHLIRLQYADVLAHAMTPKLLARRARCEELIKEFNL